MGSALTVVLAVLAAAAAAVDWYAVAGDRRRLEYVCKPATMVFLIAATVAMDPSDTAVRAWFVAALVLSLAGDVFLMLPRNLFVPGLVSFLLAHVAYVVGFAVGGLDVVGVGVGLAAVAIAVVVLGRRILGAVRASAEPELAVPVGVYVAVISAMVVAAAGSLQPVAIVGALLFYASDALIAWTRFIQDQPWGRVAIMVTYHLGQFGLVLSLAT